MSQAWSMVQSGLWLKSICIKSLCRRKMSTCLSNLASSLSNLNVPVNDPLKSTLVSQFMNLLNFKDLPFHFMLGNDTRPYETENVCCKYPKHPTLLLLLSEPNLHHHGKFLVLVTSLSFHSINSLPTLRTPPEVTQAPRPPISCKYSASPQIILCS